MLPNVIHRWENPLRQRYYLAHVHVDLLGSIVISAYWGGQHSRLGGQRHEAFASERDAATALESIKRTRLRRGYQHTHYAAP